MKENNLKTLLPKYRADELVVQEVSNELLVYDLREDKAHSLNRVAAVIWQNCDGKTQPAEIAEIVEKELVMKCDQDLVTMGLEDLSKLNLINPKYAKSSAMSRRKLLLRYGTMAIAMPIIVSLVAPTAATAQSACLNLNAPCSGGGQCCTGLCNSTCFCLARGADCGSVEGPDARCCSGLCSDAICL